ncbi:MAG: hypothetical protein ABR903_07735 [Thermodesulfovibrionales bacterium]
MFLLSSGCAGSTLLKTQAAQDERITGRYDLILLQDKNYESLKTVAFLDLRGDGYSLVPYAPDYEYAVTRDMSGQEALHGALAFLRGHQLFVDYRIRRILDPLGTTIGYEIRPLYDFTAYGVSDVMTVSYKLVEKGVVQIHINLLQSVQNYFSD